MPALLWCAYIDKFIERLCSDGQGRKWGGLFAYNARLLPVFCVSGSINYRTYASWYLEKMKKFPEEYPQIYKDFQEGKCLVKRNAGYFKLVAPDMKIQDSKQYLIFQKERYTRMFLV